MVTVSRRQLAGAILFVSWATLLAGVNPPQADRIIVYKTRRLLELHSGRKVIKSYRVALGPNSVGPKTRQGDHRTPEGLYRIDSKNGKSRFHLALHVSYPNDRDREQARKLGVSPGGDIMIHGLPDSYAYLGSLQSKYDWTDGCIAVSNAEIEEIWKLVPVGTPVEINP
jgi:murein L,D-transpeptidase YafK